MGYYLLVFVFGLFGAASALRGIELLVVGQGVKFPLFIVGFGCLYLAKKFLNKARAASS